MKPRNIISAFADLTALFLFVYLLIFPQYATEPARYALTFCGTTLVPSLFIYMVLAKMVISLPITDKLTRILGLEAFALLTGTLCGCPVGAKNAMTLYESGRITKKQAEYLYSFTNNASLTFIIGFVGGELFGDIKIGLKLLMFQLIGSLVTAIIMKKIIFGKEKVPRTLPCGNQKVGLGEAITDSAATMVNICACAVFFIVAGGAVTQLFELDTVSDSILKSVLEFSSGCAAALKAGYLALPITAFALGQTSFSVAMQVKSVVGNRLAFRPYLAGKLISCIVMVTLAFIFG